MQPEKLSKLSSWSNFDWWQMTMDILLKQSRVFYTLMIYKEIIVPVVPAAWRLLWAGDEIDSKLWVITWSEWGGLCSRVIQLTASSRLRSDCAAPAVHGGPRLRGTNPGPASLSSCWFWSMAGPATPTRGYVSSELCPHTLHGGIFKLLKWRLEDWWKVISSACTCQKDR